MNSDTPKVLHKICGTEMLNIVLDTTFAAGITSSVTVVPKENDLFKVVHKGKTTFGPRSTIKSSRVGSVVRPMVATFRVVSAFWFANRAVGRGDR